MIPCNAYTNAATFRSKTSGDSVVLQPVITLTSSGRSLPTWPLVRCLGWKGGGSVLSLNVVPVFNPYLRPYSVRPLWTSSVLGAIFDLILGLRPFLLAERGISLLNRAVTCECLLLVESECSNRQNSQPLCRYTGKQGNNACVDYLPLTVRIRLQICYFRTFSSSLPPLTARCISSKLLGS